MNQIIRHLKDSKHVLLATHINPDGDALGSMSAMGLSLEALNKKITLYNESKIPAMYRFLPLVYRIVQHLNKASSYDTAIVFDCGNLQRMGKISSTVREMPVIINIDHHISNNYFGNFHMVDTSACATAEIVYRLIKQMSVPINKAIATSIYTGILTDTGSFRFSNTNKNAFAICNEMIEKGVDPYYISRQVYETYSFGRIKLLNMALDSLEISDNGKLSLMAVTKDMLEKTGTQPEYINGLINYAKSIENVEVAVLIQEVMDNNKKTDNTTQFHVSLRSNGKVDVAAIASSFGGGGHTMAAGFSIESTLSDIKTRIIDLAEEL